MKLTLIITTYNSPDLLEMTLISIKNQTFLPSEVIIADDGSNDDTADLIVRYRKKFKINIIHSWQKDLGFRAARSRNNAILKSAGEYIVLVDGDMILHNRFVENHVSHAETGYFTQGTRVLLTKKESAKVLKDKKTNLSCFSFGLQNRKNSIHSKLLSKLFSNKKNYLTGIKSCNMAFFKKDCLRVNGFNNGFEGWGREDSEFIVRLLNSGVNRKNIRFNAIQFHLWHNESSRASLENNNQMLEDAINEFTIKCINGINSLDNHEN
tara:strand:- start:411 stop:1208 length:798 start_codon:yes stop_codon:yes gene_type:complete